MTQIAKGTFQLHWDQDPPFDDAPGAALHRVTVTKTWTGEISGASVAHLIAAMSPVKDSAGYVAVERMDVALAGRKGTFVIQHAAYSSAEGRRDLSILTVPGTATGELEGIEGEMLVTIDEDDVHFYEFRYQLPE